MLILTAKFRHFYRLGTEWKNCYWLTPIFYCIKYISILLALQWISFFPQSCQKRLFRKGKQEKHRWRWNPVSLTSMAELPLNKNPKHKDLMDISFSKVFTCPARVRHPLIFKCIPSVFWQKFWRAKSQLYKYLICRKGALCMKKQAAVHSLQLFPFVFQWPHDLH